MSKTHSIWKKYNLSNKIYGERMSTLTCNPRNEKKLTNRRHHFGEWTGRGWLKMPALVTAQGDVSTHQNWKDTLTRLCNRCQSSTIHKSEVIIVKMHQNSVYRAVHRMIGSVHPVSPASTRLWFKKHTGRHTTAPEGFTQECSQGSMLAEGLRMSFSFILFLDFSNNTKFFKEEK